MIRVVLDSNVIVSGLFSTSQTMRVIFDGLASERYRSVTTISILSEVAEAWTSTYWTSRIPESSLESVLTNFADSSEVIALHADWFGVAPHRHDDHILGTAVEGHCEYLVTGDHELLDMSSFRGVRIMMPAELATLLDANP